MSYYEFIQNYSDDDTPLGELARLVIQDGYFPKDESSEEKLLLYFRSLDLEYSYLEYCKLSFFIYNQLAKS
ncbi:YozE family protein [Mammaliicoccus sciuri]|uniref:YozE family protein n=1 Tax=Mammaliicoccus sciuri TaxID=1296 RepID=UPI00378EA983